MANVAGEAELIHTDQIRWLELRSRGRIKVRSARLGRAGFVSGDGASSESALTSPPELGLFVEASSGSKCFVPLSAIVRVDYQ